MIAGQGLLACY